LKDFNINTEVVLGPKGVRRLQEGHLWVYEGDVLSEPGGTEEPIVRLLDSAQNPLGYAFYSGHSKIRIRLISKEPDPPDREMFRTRIAAAVERRRGLSQQNSAHRLVYGESDLLPSIIVDRYGDFLALQTLTRGADLIKTMLVEILIDLIRPAGIVERNDVKARRLEGLPESRGALWGTIPERVEIQESGIRFVVDLLGGQKTGFFLDQRENRLAAARYAFGKALDCFTNSGGFALHFAPHCDQVLGLDSSSSAIEQARINAETNRLTNVRFENANVFDRLREFERAKERFDVVCLDPPAFAKNRSALTAALGGYKEINLRAMKLLNPDGILITSSCSYHLSETVFAHLLHEAALDAHRYVQILERRTQGADHPILTGMPETNYLKCFVLRAL
jgi:23S rRNA (cytosine1962-C5)-methyltransferase